VPITDPFVDAWLRTNAPPRDPVLLEMEEYGAGRRFPLVGPAVGSLLEVLARSIGARRVFELGSGFGYSAAWWLRAMTPAAEDGGQVVLTDLDAENARRGGAYLTRLGHAGKFRYEVGDALEAFAREDGPFDVVFCDVDKEDYPRVVAPAVARLRPGGLLVTDNALWGGTVADPSCDEPSTVAVREYLRRVTTHPLLRTTVLPLRDGVAVSVRLSG
jgi:predicted O-methyltransferase YrrM